MNENGADKNKSIMRISTKGNMRNDLFLQSCYKAVRVSFYFITFGFFSSLTLLLFKLVLCEEDGPHQLPDWRLNGDEEFPGVSAEKQKQTPVRKKTIQKENV